jgi:hypothetical protein
MLKLFVKKSSAIIFIISNKYDKKKKLDIWLLCT